MCIRASSGDGDHTVFLQITGQGILHAPALAADWQVTDNQTGREIGARLEVLVITSGVADMRVGQRNNLLAIGRIGKYFLIAGHRRIEHHLAAGSALGACLLYTSRCV